MDPELRAATIAARGDDHTAMFQAFVRGNVALDHANDTGAAAAAPQSIQRIANVHFGNAVDKILQGIGVSMKQFLVEDFPKLVKSHEMRYFADAACGDGNVRKRSCIKDLKTNECRFEVEETWKDGKLYAPLAITSLDRGSIGQPHAVWLEQGAKLRIVTVYDTWHRCHGYIDDSYKASIAYYDKLEGAVAYECFAGPWLGHGNFRKFEGCADRFFSRNDHTNVIYTTFYPYICKASGVPASVARLADHKATLWHTLRFRKEHRQPPQARKMECLFQ